MDRVVPVKHITALSRGAELDADAAFAVICRLSRSSLGAAWVLEMLEDSRVTIRMPVLVLHAVLTDEGEARAFLVLCRPGIVEAVSKSIEGFDRRDDPSRSRPLHNLLLSGIGHIDDGATRRARMFLPGIVFHLIQPVLELERQVVVAALGIRSDPRPHQRNDGGQAQRHLEGGAHRHDTLRGGVEFLAQRGDQRF